MARILAMLVAGRQLDTGCIGAEMMDHNGGSENQSDGNSDL